MRSLCVRVRVFSHLMCMETSVGFVTRKTRGLPAYTALYVQYLTEEMLTSETEPHVLL